MGLEKTLTSWNSLQGPVHDAFWGNVTASIDWCEANYDVSRHVAEFVNTLSNIPFLVMASYGIYSTVKYNLPKYLVLPYVGTFMIGTGSFLFHATLSYHMQLLDELPMLWAATFSTYCAFNTQKPGERQLIPYIGLWLFLLVSSVTVGYLYYPDPVLHQIAFAGTLSVCVFRSVYLCYHNLLDTPFEKQRNKEITRLQGRGVAFMVLAFSIWLVDCFACDPLTRFKYMLGKPWAFLLEFHAWWHLGTGLGAHYLSAALQLLVLSIRDDPRDFYLEWAAGGWLPYIAQVSGKKDIRLVTNGNGSTPKAYEQSKDL